MKHPVCKVAILLMIAALMSACATSYQPVPPFTPVRVDAGGYALKTQNMIVIMDASSSMDEGYQQWKEFDLASAVVRNMAETVPEDRGIKSGSPHRRQCNQAGPFQEPSGSVYQGGLRV